MKAARLLGAQAADLESPQYSQRQQGQGSAALSHDDKNRRGIHHGSTSAAAPHNIDLSDVALAPGEGGIPGFLRNDEEAHTSRNGPATDARSRSGQAMNTSPGFGKASPSLGPTAMGMDYADQAADAHQRESFSSGISPTTTNFRLDTTAHPNSPRRQTTQPKGVMGKGWSGFDNASVSQKDAVSSIDPPLTRPHKKHEEISPFLFQEGDGLNMSADMSSSAGLSKLPRSTTDVLRGSGQDSPRLAATASSLSISAAQTPTSSTVTSPTASRSRLGTRADIGATGFDDSAAVSSSLSLANDNALAHDSRASPTLNRISLHPSSLSQTNLSHTYTSAQSSTGPAVIQGKDKRTRTFLSMFRKKTDPNLKDYVAPSGSGNLRGSTSRSDMHEVPVGGQDEQRNANDAPDTRKKSTRPAKAEKESRKGRGGPNQGDMRAGIGSTFSSPFASGHSQQTAAPINFDLNIEDINDFVDTSKRKTSLVGPKDERLSLSGETSYQDHHAVSGNSPSPTMTRDDGSDAVHGTRSALTRSSDFEAQRPSTGQLSRGKAGGSHRRGNQSLSKEVELSEILASMNDGDAFNSTRASASSGLSVASSELRPSKLRDGNIGIPRSLAESSQSDRKASQTSNGSDISPMTSTSNIARLDGRQGRLSTGNSIPTPQKFPDVISKNDGAAKGDSPEGKITWSAPDSWAVQPTQGKLQDHLRDADGDGLDDDEGRSGDDSEEREAIDASRSTSSPQNSPTTNRYDRGRPSIAPSTMSTLTSGSGGNNSDRSNSIASVATAREIRNARRGTTDSAMSGQSSVGGERTSNAQRPEDVEEEQVPAGHNSASRGVPRAAIAAAAGKLGLNRAYRSKPASRPGTGDKSRQSAFDEQVTPSRSYKRAPSSMPPNKTTFIRVWRDDGTHSIMSIAMSKTTADLRSLLARKFGDSTGACNLFVRDKGSERPLGESERPAQLQKRRLEQAGYKDSDSLDELGREDLSFLIKFVFRPDRALNFDPAKFGNTAADFNVLDLRKRNLEMVPIFLYRHAEWIKSLNLSGNPMRDIPSDFVQLCTNLSTLCLSQLALKRVPQSIKQAKHLTHLDISDNRIAELWHIDMSEIPQLMSLKAQNNRLSELPTYFERMQTLRDLNISNNGFETFPVVICKSSALSQLDISFNTISSLPPEIAELQQLQRLVLVGNTIVQLPACIETLSNLQAIDMRRNLLVNASALFALPKLEILQCQNNVIKQLDVTIGTRLRTLEIGRNPLSKAIFRASDTCALTTLNLSSADISKLDDKVLGNLPKLTELILNNNNMLALPENLGHLTQLRRLSCTHNVLASLPESLGALQNLVELQVQDNNLKSLPSSIWMCSSLKTVNVSSNVLESFPTPPLLPKTSAAPEVVASALPANGIAPSIIESRKTSASSESIIAPLESSRYLPLCSSLEKLRLADNRLSEDVFEVVSQMTELRILNLSYNGIYDLPSYGLSKLAKLRELYLSGNTFGSIPADEMPYLTELRTLHLNGNKLQTLPAELGQNKMLVNLDVSNNQLKYNISNTQYDWNWNSNPNLRSLNLSGNKRLEIKSNPVIISGPNLPTGMKRTDSSDFQRLADLRLLGLMDVTVTLQKVPDEHDDRRVRTSLSQINQMSYGISDALGQHDHLSIIDVVIPRFRKMDTECLFGLFAGRGHKEQSSSRIAYHLAQWINYRLQSEVQRIESSGTDGRPQLDKIPDIMRRTFLRLQKEYADMLLSEHTRKLDKSDVAAVLLEAQWRCGAASVLAYIVDQTLFVANAGDALAVLSRNGEAVVVSTKHEPFDRNETSRIRSAEGWVSLHGQVNDTLDVSRGFGYYHLEPVVNAQPAVSCTTLTDSDEFVILANHTLWDYIPYQTAVDIARMEREDPMLAAQKLRDFAISYGAEGSIMVMIVAVGDLFAKAPQRGGVFKGTPSSQRFADAMGFEPVYDNYRRVLSRRDREELPGDRNLARLQREVAPPVGQVALVFTDIRNSTALWETNNGMPSAWRQHNWLVRRQLRSIGGYEVKNEGDAFMLSFPSVTSALYFCFQVQIQLLKENWPHDILESEEGKEVYDEATGELIYRGLSVRMGIHWGSPVCEADPITRRMDYFGPMVNRAARISSAAEGGQIFVSRDVIAELRAIMGSVEGIGKRRKEEDGDETIELSETPLEVPIDGDEDEYRLLQANESRDIVALRRMGFAITELGERSLKGLETPELLNLVYPKCLSARFTKFLESLEAPRRDGVPKTPGAIATPKIGEGGDMLAEAGRKLKQKPAVQVFEPTAHLLNVEEVKSLGYICIRLEALAQGKVHESVSEYGRGDLDGTLSPSGNLLRSPFQTADQRSRSSSLQSNALLPSSTSRQRAIEAHLQNRPELLLSGMRDEATDEELQGVVQELCGRINVALGSLALRKFVASQFKTEDGAFGPNLIDIVDMLQGTKPKS